MVRLALVLPFLLACADDGRTLSADEQPLVGCWEGQQGSKLVRFRFHADGDVSQQLLPDGATYTGTFARAGDQLTFDFGEEPPTYTITLTPSELAIDGLGVFARVACEG